MGSDDREGGQDAMRCGSWIMDHDPMFWITIMPALMLVFFRARLSSYLCRLFTMCVNQSMLGVVSTPPHYLGAEGESDISAIPPVTCWSSASGACWMILIQRSKKTPSVPSSMV
jgi:hypothetical protein